jgi:hypothetical protein
MFIRAVLMTHAFLVPVLAHDLWLLPPVTAPVPGKVVVVSASSGSEFPKSEHAPDTSAFVRRVVVQPDGTRSEAEAAGKEGDVGLLRFTPEKPGLTIVAVETRPRLIMLEADKFNAYLVSDGLPHIYALRVREKTLDQPGKERYSKSPKLLLRIGEGGPGDATRVVGLPLEIVPMRDPFALKIGDTLPVRVLFKGEPLAGANLGWAHPGDGESPAGTVRTNGRGEALIPIARTGLMTIRLTYMTRPKAAEYEWESFWTTLTWVVPG